MNRIWRFGALRQNAQRLRRRFQILRGVGWKTLSFSAPYRSLSHVGWSLIGGLAFVFYRNDEFAPIICQTTLLFVGLACLATFDARYFLIPNTHLLFVTGVGLTTIDRNHGALVMERLTATVIGFLAIVGLNFVYRAIRGRTGLGRGDAKLLATAGLWLGLSGLPTVVLWASLSGLGAAVIMSLNGEKLEAATAIPFGPHLALGFWLVWLFGPLLM